MVKIGTGPDIELFEMHGPQQAQSIRASDFGITHFALYTDDINASVERFEKAGGTPLTAPRAIPSATDKGPGNKVCYCRMPWGPTMEFNPPPARTAHQYQTDQPRGSEQLLYWK